MKLTRTAPQNSLKKAAKVLLVLLIVFGTGFGWWWYQRGPGYYAELETVRTELNNIPGVEVLDLTWRDDDDFPLWLRLHSIGAKLRVEGKGEIGLHNLRRESFQNAQNLMVAYVGDYAFRKRGEGYLSTHEAATGEPVRSQFSGTGIDIGSKGDFASLFPFQISNVQSVIDHYDEIAQIIEQMPATPATPGYFKNKEGVEVIYWTAQKDASENDPLWKADPLWHLEYSDLRASVLLEGREHL